MTQTSSASDAFTTFGEMLKHLRKRARLTQRDLGSAVGYSETYITRLEGGTRHPDPRAVKALFVDALHLSDEPELARRLIQLAEAAHEKSQDSSTEFDTAYRARRSNLPAPLTSFVDRARELAEVREKLLRPDVRLLTLVGPPGIGKTRLSIQAGQTVLNHFADGVWFVSLAPISDPANVLPAVARVFDMAEAGPAPLSERLGAHLRSREVLLILDNFEQVLDAAPQVADLLKACPKVKALVTSRELLHAYGEHEYPMPALSLPPRDKKLTFKQVAEFDAIKLFAARAEAVQPGFALNADNAPVVADICARLDGVPLAIELATAQLRRFTSHTLLDALKTALLQSLAGAARDVEPRQHTLRNAIQWSYDLLTPAERAAFDRLGVFVGGCTTEAALTVCQLADDSILFSLTDRSLLRRDANERWTMLEMIREFALERLSGNASEQAEQVQQRHAEYFVRVFEVMLSGPRYQINHQRVMDIEQHNARVALRWLLDRRNVLAGVLARCMGEYLFGWSLPSEGRRWLPEVLSCGLEFTPPIRHGLLSWASICAWQQHGFAEGLRYIQEALAVSRAMNWQSQISKDLSMLSHIFYEMDDCAQAKHMALEALEISRGTPDATALAGALMVLGQAELVLGDMGAAEAHFEEAYTLRQAPDLRQEVHLYAAMTCKGLGVIALSHRDYDRAFALLSEGLRLSPYIHNKLWLLDPLAGVIGTMPHRTTADVQRAAKIWGAAEVLNEKMGLVNAPDNRRRTDALIAEARRRINPKAFDAAWAEGRELSLDEAIELAME
jgi:predicted ATPase